MINSVVNEGPKLEEILPVAPLNSICPIMVGVAGGSASGKTTLCNNLVSEIGGKNCLVISLDSFYRPLTPEEAVGFNFDHPDAFDFDLCYEVLKKLVNRQSAEIPIYNYKKNDREEETTKVDPCDLILFEGILALYDKRILSLLNIKLFIDCDNDIRLYRRILRDINERGREVTHVLYQYNKFVKPAYDEMIKPTIRHANLIVPGRSDNTVAMKFVVQNLRLQLSRMAEMKEDMTHNAFYADILDSCWLNIKAENEETQGSIDLHKTDRILFLRDGQDKTECFKLFNLLSSRFSEALYITFMLELLRYGVKIMTNYKDKTESKFKIVHYMNIDENSIQVEENQTVGIIVPFLSEGSLSIVNQRVQTLLEKNKGVELFVISIFADLSTIASLYKLQKDILVVNILCIVHMKAFLDSLHKNCEVESLDFRGDKLLSQLMVKKTYSEILNVSSPTLKDILSNKEIEKEIMPNTKYISR